MKKYMIILLGLCMILALTGCCSHEWQEATCLAPRTCIECGKTEGEALSHNWQMPDCVNPMTCDGCGQTKGQPLGHTAGEATYFSDAVCSVCGDVVAEKLPADMELCGMTEFMQVGVAYPYTTICYEDPSKYTTGEATVIRYEIVNSAEGYPARKGYQWHLIEIKSHFFDENARYNGISIDHCYENYYHIDYWDDSDSYDEETGVMTFKILYNDQEMAVYCMPSEYEWSGWYWENNVKQDYCITRFAFCIPVGYDGVVLGCLNAQYGNIWDEGLHIDDIYSPENVLLFRLGEEFCTPAATETPASGKK